MDWGFCIKCADDVHVSMLQGLGGINFCRPCVENLTRAATKETSSFSSLNNGVASREEALTQSRGVAKRAKTRETCSLSIPITGRVEEKEESRKE